MDKAIKRELKRLWWTRSCCGVVTLAALVLSGLQIQAWFKHQALKHSWVVELSQAVEEATTIGEAPRSLALDQVHSIAKQHYLFTTQSVTLDRELALSLYLYLDLELARDLNRDLNRARSRSQDGDPDRDLALNRDLALALARALARALDENLYQDLNRDLYLDRVLYLDRARDLNRALDLYRDLYLDLALDRSQKLALVLARSQDGALDRVLDQDLYRDLYLDRDLDLDRDLARDLNRALNRDQALYLDLYLNRALDQAWNPYFMFLIKTDLKNTYGLTLYQGQELERLVNQESNRSRSLLKAQILLIASTLTLLTLLFILTRLRGPSGIPPNAHLIAFLPEECVAEIGYLSRRLKKQKASPWKIRLRVAEEFVTLLWVFYVQSRIDNLFLPSDRRIDDD